MAKSPFIEAATPAALAIAYGILKGSYKSPAEERQWERDRKRYGACYRPDKCPPEDLDAVLDLPATLIPDALTAMLEKNHVPDLDTLRGYFKRGKMADMLTPNADHAELVYQIIMSISKNHSDGTIRQRARDLQDPAITPEWPAFAQARKEYKINELIKKDNKKLKSAKKLYENPEFSQSLKKLATYLRASPPKITEKTPQELMTALQTAENAVAYGVESAGGTLEQLHATIPAVEEAAANRKWTGRVGAQAKNLAAIKREYEADKAREAENPARER